MKKFDVAIIGAGPGGSEAALESDRLGFKTLLIEKEELGGVCLNWGCIPTKALLTSSKLFSKIQHGEKYGISGSDDIRFNISEALQQKNNIVSNLKKGLDWQLSKTKVTRIQGTAKLTDKTHVQIELKDKKEIFETKYIILATGSKPKTFPGFPYDGKNILSSTDILSLNQIPKSIVIIGAGAVGVEFASFYNAIGTQVTLLEALPRPVPLEDEEIGKRLEMIFKKRGINIQTSVYVTKIQTETDTMRVSLDGGTAVHGEKVLIAIGRERNLKNLGLEALGVKFQGSSIHTNSYLETNISNIFAIGDLIAGPQFAHAAAYEARLVISNLKSSEKKKVRFETIPSAIFTDPPIASIGLNKEEAVKQGQSIRETKVLMSTNGKAWVERETEGLAKLVVDEKTKRILGASMIGLEAPELIGIIALAIQKNLTSYDLAQTVLPHPTVSELFSELAKQTLT